MSLVANDRTWKSQLFHSYAGTDLYQWLKLRVGYTQDCSVISWCSKWKQCSVLAPNQSVTKSKKYLHSFIHPPGINSNEWNQCLVYIWIARQQKMHLVCQYKLTLLCNWIYCMRNYLSEKTGSNNNVKLLFQFYLFNSSILS